MSEETENKNLGQSNDAAAERRGAPAVPEHLLSDDLNSESPAPAAEQTEANDELVPEPAAEPSAVVVGPSRNIFFRLYYKCRTHPKVSLPILLVVIIAALAAIPITRYALAGTFLTQNFAVQVFDETTQKPVSGVTLKLRGQTAKTDADGRATLHIKVGQTALTAEKKYYQSAHTDVLVPIASQKNGAFRLLIKATGRQVPVIVTDKITDKPIKNALIAVLGTETRTDQKGSATLVLPADEKTVSARVSAGNYNTLHLSIAVTEQAVPENNAKLVPSGKLYFLSKLSGKIDVVKTNLDGSERQTVLAGTGNESSTDTVLLASRDWKYLALKAKRSNGLAKMYLIDTASDELTTIDEGNASFSLVGWNGDRFIYVTNRDNYNNWQPGAHALKSYDAVSGKLTVIDQTTAEGTGQYDYAYNTFSGIYILENELVYAKNWYSSYVNPYVSYSMPNRLSGKSASLISLSPDGTAKKAIKDFPVPADTSSVYFVDVKAYEPDSVVVRVPNGTAASFYEYENGTLTSRSDLSDQKFYNDAYPTYLVSPGGNQVFWSEARDGKNTLFVGDKNAENSKQIATLSPYVAYGWYSDKYLLLSKNSSELYIMAASGGEAKKVTDYHKPFADFSGYGYGYGGL
jgi:hypothetical protein